MIDDNTRKLFVHLLTSGPTSEHELLQLLASWKVGTGRERRMIRDLLTRGYLVRDAYSMIRISIFFEAFKDDFGLSLTGASRGRPPMIVYPEFQGRKIIDTRKCFVVMPFAAVFNSIYVTIRGAVEDAGMSCHRADDFFQVGGIMESIWCDLLNSGIIIADLTDRNPNVFYELGIAHVIGRPVIIITQHPENLPSDIQHNRWLSYTADPSGLEMLRSNLSNALADVKRELLDT